MTVIHFIGTPNTAAFDIAETLFGPPDFIHPRMTDNVERLLAEDDTVIFVERVKQWMLAR